MKILLIVGIIIGLIVFGNKVEKKKREKFKIPKQAKKIKYFQGYDQPLTNKVYYWLDSTCINFCNTKSETDDPIRIEISEKNIIGFGQIGDVTTSTSGGGVGLGGAAAGGLLFGSTGAIIGSRKATVTTTTDTRKVVLQFIENDINKSILLDNKIYDDLSLYFLNKRIS